MAIASKSNGEPVLPRSQHGPLSARQEEILEALENRILTQGFRSLRLTALTKELGTSFATLYQLAPSKDELVALVIERWYRKTAASAFEEISAIEDSVEKLTRWSEMGVAGIAPTSMEFWRDANAHGAIRVIVQRYAHYYGDVLRSIVDEGIAQGVFRPVNTELLVAVWEFATTEIGQTDGTLGTAESMEYMAQGWVDLVLHGIMRD